jgi:hypothetical protein
MKNDLAVGLLALAFAGIYYYFASDIHRSLLSDEVGAAGLPKVYAVAVALLGGFLLWQSFGARAAAPETGGDSGVRVRQHVRAAGLLLLGVAYLVLISSLGYLLTIFLLIAAVALYCGAALNFRLLLISAAGGVVFWLVFARMFDMPLPTGTLWQWLAG